MDVFQDIREKNVIDYGTKFDEWAPRILVNQYSDRTHFLFELLQNAEDAEATEIEIALFKNKLLLKHNGRAFSDDDVRGICGVSASTKRESKNRIGKFGIGFKSVYAYTNTPRIRSGIRQFEIRNLIMPYEIEKIDCGKYTYFELPFSDEANSQSSFQEIAVSLRKNIVADCMLTLSHIRKITYSIEGDASKHVITKNVRILGKGIQDISLLESNGMVTPVRTKLIGFISDDEKPSLIAYKISETNGVRSIIPITNSYLYAYFPTAIETHQAFYIHAPFDTTPARDNIRKNEYNQGLVERISCLIRTSIDWLKNHQLITLKYFNQVFPIYHYADDALLRPIYDDGVDLIRQKAEILPTMHVGTYSDIDHTYLPESQNIIQCFDEKILPQLVNDVNAHWMEKAIASEYSRPFKDYLQKNFELKVLGWALLSKNLTATILERKDDEWLSFLLKCIQPYCFSERNEERINAKELPLVRLSDGSHCYAQTKNGRANVYINNPEACTNKIKESVLLDVFVKNFYMRVLEIPMYDVFEEIRSNILPSYHEEKTVTFEQNIEDIKLIGKGFQENAPKAIALVENEPILLSTNGWVCPNKAYVPESFFKTHSAEYSLMTEMNLSWLAEEYKGKVGTDLLLQMGCHASLHAIELSETEYSTLLQKNDYFNYQKYVDLYSSKAYHASRDGYLHRRTIDQLTGTIERLGLNASLSLAEYVANNLSVYQLNGTVFAANDAALRGKAVITIENLPSAIGLLLTSSSWLYGRDGITKKRPDEFKKSEIHPDYISKASALIKILPLVKEDSIVSELIEQYDERYQDFLTELLNNKDALNDAFLNYRSKKITLEKNVSRSLGEIKKESEVDVNSVKCVISSDSVDNDDPMVDVVVRDIIKKTSERKRKTGIERKHTSSTKDDEEILSSCFDDTEEELEEDDYIKPPVNYEKKIEQAKEKSAAEIDRIARYEYLQRKVKGTKKYSYDWFSLLLEMESLNIFENTQNSKEISISFEKVELEPGTSRTLILSRPSRYIPQYMEDLADIPLVLITPKNTKSVAIEVANVQSYSLRVKLRTNSELDDIDLNDVCEAKISARNPVFLLESLRKQFQELGFVSDFDMQAELPHNIEFVFGPPGTGKTTYLADKVLRELIKKDEGRILVLAPTNKAADVLTARTIGVMGAESNYLDWLVRFGVTNDENLEKSGVFRDKTTDIRSLRKSVVVTTIARFSYDYFMPKDERLYLRDLNWDYIIIDEASMISLATIIYPIYKKTPKKFIIAGDPFQIEPITSVDIWKNENIYTIVELNSFEKPTTIPIQYPVQLLTTQYRSVPEVGRVFSEFAYGGILKHNRSRNSQRDLHIKDDFDINTLNIVKFPVSKFESIYRSKILQHRSPYQIYSALFSFEFATFLARSIKANNGDEKYSIGIIAPYKAQADLIHKLVVSADIPRDITISVGTIHGFQGDECDIIMVVLNTPPTIAATREMFLNKVNIINVAISRARDYLIVLMPDDNTDNIGNLKLVKKTESIMNKSKEASDFDSAFIEELIFGSKSYLEENTFSTSHQNVNVYGLPEKRYEIRSEDTAIDIQVHNNVEQP